VLRRARRPSAGRCDAARARSAVLRGAGRGALSQRRDLLHGHEAAHQARAGAGARSGPAVSRRADQRHGPEGARRDARARARSRLRTDVEDTCDTVVVMDKGTIATAGPIDALKQPRGRVYELRVKTAGPVEPFLEQLRAAGMDCHATDDDVMRVFVPGEGGAR